MPDLRRRRCQVCHKLDNEVGVISWRGKCVECAKLLVAENIDGLVAMTGEPKERWRRGMALSVGAVIIENRNTTS